MVDEKGIKEVKINKNSKFTSKPSIVLQEEEDRWGLLFDPESDARVAINPVSVIIWKHFDGKHTIDDLSEKVHEYCINVPGDVEVHIEEFIHDLLKRGFVSEKSTGKRHLK